MSSHQVFDWLEKVTNEALRLASVAPGIMRKVLQDIQVNGKFTIWLKTVF